MASCGERLWFNFRLKFHYQLVHNIRRSNLMRNVWLSALVCALVAPVQVGAAEIVDMPALLRDLASDKAPTREQAAATAGNLGPAAGDAVPALAKLLEDSEARVRHEALLALEKIGPAAGAAVPALQRLLGQSAPSMKLGAIHVLGAIGADAKATNPQLVELSKSEDPAMAAAAVLALVRIHGTRKEELDRAIPVLIKSLQSTQLQVRNDASSALAEIGAASVPALIKAVEANSTDAVQATRAAVVLGMIGSDAVPAVAALKGALASRNERLQEEAARALGSIGPEARPAISDLMGLLASKIGTLRATAATSLGQIGEAAAESTPTLVKLVKDPDAHVRREAVEALGGIGPKAAAGIPALIEALNDDAQGAVTVRAAESLGRMGAAAAGPVAAQLKNDAIKPLALLILADLGADAKGAVPALRTIITQDKDASVRREAQIVLAHLGPAAAEAKGDLLTVLKDETSPVRPSALYALVKMGAKDELLPIISKTIEDKNSKHLRDVSAWALLTIDPKNPQYVRQALPVLINGLTNEMPVARREVAMALRKLGPTAEVAVPELVKALKAEQDQRVRTEIISALGDIGPGAAEALPLVLQSLSDSVPMIRYSACYALGKFGAKARDALPVLKNNLQGRDKFLAVISAWAIVNIAPAEAGDDAVSLLTQALALPDARTRIEAVSALAQLGPKAKSALPAINKLSADQDEGVRKAADAAAKKISG